MKRTLIKQAKLVNEGKIVQGSVLVEGDEIKSIFPMGNPLEGQFDEVIDAQDYYLLPGIIDDHVHFRDPGLTQKGDICSESRAAAAGGVTTIMDMPNTQPQTTSIEALKAKLQLLADKSVVNYSCYFGATNQNIDLLAELEEYGVCGIKVFMGASTGNMLVDRIKSLEAIFKNAKHLIATHCENQDLIRQNTQHYQALHQGAADLPLAYHPLIRSAEACYQSSALAVELAKKHQARLHLLHISTAKELELFSNQALADKQITAEACVSHLLFSEEDYEEYGTKIKCNPAIKTKADQAALRQALLSNKIDVIATDHAPHLVEDKQGGALKAASGIPIIQFSLVSMLNLVDQGVLPLETLVEKMCHNPAQIYRIKKRGFIKEGYKADLVLVQKDSPWTLTPEIIQSSCGWSPLENKKMNWKVIKTWINGHLIYNKGTINSNPKGQQIQFL